MKETENVTLWPRKCCSCPTTAMDDQYLMLLVFETEHAKLSTINKHYVVFICALFYLKVVATFPRNSEC